MKVLKFHGMKDEDYLQLSFEGEFNPRAQLHDELEAFLQALEAHACDWMPDVVHGEKQRKYSRRSLWMALEEGRDEHSMGIGLFRTKWPPLDMALSLWFPPLPSELGIFISVKPLSFFAEQERCRHVVEMIRAWASHYPVRHASAHGIDDKVLAGSPDFGRDEKTARRDGFDRIYELFWINVFGPRLVEAVGRERMLSTPAWRVEALPNGAVLLVLWPTPTDFASDTARELQARAHVHLRPDLDYATVLRALHERSAALAPVEPRFAPELTPLLSRVVDATPSHLRSRAIRDFNAWCPPEPEEWLPAEASLPPDVSDREAALAHYRLQAEYLVALLHAEVPSVFTATPESLSDIDFQLWREDFPSRHLAQSLQERALPALGAYLGEVLVRHLGGQWIPRQNLEEAQVRVGARTWLPFARARRYLESRRALLDFSLSGLFHAAARHRA